jgi:hypothetical protein
MVACPPAEKQPRAFTGDWVAAEAVAAVPAASATTIATSNHKRLTDLPLMMCLPG